MKEEKRKRPCPGCECCELEDDDATICKDCQLGIEIELRINKRKRKIEWDDQRRNLNLRKRRTLHLGRRADRERLLYIADAPCVG